MNKSALKSSLYDAIQKWVYDNCETDEWQDTGIIIANETVQHMTVVAFAIFEAIKNSQEFMEREYNKEDTS